MDSTPRRRSAQVPRRQRGEQLQPPQRAVSASAVLRPAALTWKRPHPASQEAELEAAQLCSCPGSCACSHAFVSGRNWVFQQPFLKRKR